MSAAEPKTVYEIALWLLEKEPISDDAGTALARIDAAQDSKTMEAKEFASQLSGYRLNDIEIMEGICAFMNMDENKPRRWNGHFYDSRIALRAFQSVTKKDFRVYYGSRDGRVEFIIRKYSDNCGPLYQGDKLFKAGQTAL